MRKWSACRDNFQLEVPPSGRIPWKKLPNCGWFAVYDKAPNGYSDASCLFKVEGLDGLRRWYRRAIKGTGIENRSLVWVQTAATEADLMDPVVERLVWNITREVETLKARDNRSALRRVRAALERKDTQPSPKRKDKAAWKIETLHNLANGMKLEDAINHPLRKQRLESAYQELWRYCHRFYEFCFLRSLDTSGQWQTPIAARYLKERFGLEFPRDLEAAREAYRRGRGRPKARA